MRHRFLKPILTIVVAICLISLPILLDAQQTGDFEKGKQEGKEKSKGSVWWLLGGFLCGIFATIYVLIQKPEPPVGALVGKSQDYIRGFTYGFKKKTRSKNLVYSIIGWAVGAAVALAVFFGNSSDDL